MKLKPNCIRDLLEVFESEIQDANCTYNFPSWESFQEYPALENTPQKKLLITVSNSIYPVSSIMENSIVMAVYL